MNSLTLPAGGCQGSAIFSTTSRCVQPSSFVLVLADVHASFDAVDHLEILQAVFGIYLRE